MWVGFMGVALFFTRTVKEPAIDRAKWKSIMSRDVELENKGLKQRDWRKLGVLLLWRFMSV